MPTRTYLSLGSNLGDRNANLKRAIAELGRFGKLKEQSSFYETEPVEMQEQPWFLNCAVELDTDLTPSELMSSALGIEEEMGRLRSQAKGPRVIDLDILLFGDLIIEMPDLEIPHPRMHRRRFVLEPLAEIAAEVKHPLLRKTIAQLRNELPKGQITRRIA